MANTPSTTDAFLQMFQQERESFWQRHSNLSEQERQQLWYQRILETDNASSRQHLASIPRTMSYGGPSATRPTPSLEIPLNRTEGLSIQSAPAAVSMSRSISSISGASINGPFSTTTNWGIGLNWPSDEPPRAYTLSSESGSLRQSAMSRIPELDVYNPSDYVAKLEEPFTFSSTLPTSETPDLSPAACYQDSTRLTVNTSPYQWSSSFDGSTSPSTPTSGELMTPSTLASEMSRQPSIASGTFPGAFNMMRLQSSCSNVSDFVPTESPLSALSSSVKPRLTDSDCASFLSHVSGAAIHEDTFSSAQFPSCTNVQTSQSQSELVEDMKRSASSQSSKSVCSNRSSRPSRRRQEQIAQSARPIAPKANAALMMRQPSDHKMVRIKSQDGSSKDVAQITKAPYIRPTHPKIMCQLCNDYPDGFRGEHELRRHTERAHAKIRRVWVTVDASPDKKFLANCKQCRNNKKYGAYYNAAAHLRRAHFHPRKRGRKGKNDEKRGGKGGGDDPPMEHLKQFWMKEIEEVVPNNDDMEQADEQSDEQSDAVPVTTADSSNCFHASAASPDFDQAFVPMMNAEQPTEFMPQQFADQPAAVLPYDDAAAFEQMNGYNMLDAGVAIPLAGQMLVPNADDLTFFQLDDQQRYNAALANPSAFYMQQ